MKKRVLFPPSPRRRGAPLGNHNALKHGRFTRERRALAAEVRAYIKKTRALAASLTELARAAKALAALQKRTAEKDLRAFAVAGNDSARGAYAMARGGRPPSPGRTIILLKKPRRDPDPRLNSRAINHLAQRSPPHPAISLRC